MAQNPVLEIDNNITTLKEKDLDGIRCRLIFIRDLKQTSTVTATSTVNVQNNGYASAF